MENLKKENQAALTASEVILRRGDKQCPEVFDYTIYTDGSCPKVGGAGGWAFVVVGPHQEEIFRHSGPLFPATNNTAELMGIYQALMWVVTHTHYAPTRIITDSKYCQEGIMMWMWRWAQNDWKNSSGSPAKNQPEFKAIMKLLLVHPKNFLFAWVKGHAGNRWNEIADKLATAQTREQRQVAADPDNWHNFDGDFDEPVRRPARK